MPCDGLGWLAGGRHEKASLYSIRSPSEPNPLTELRTLFITLEKTLHDSANRKNSPAHNEDMMGRCLFWLSMRREFLCA